MVQLQRDIKKLKDANIQVIAISYDPVKALSKFAKNPKYTITFPLLSDPDSKVIKAFDVLNKKAKGSFRGVSLSGIPHPGTFVLDEKGVIRAKLFLEGYRDRHTTKALIEAAKKIK